jgi:hypothetical protein
MVVKDTLLKNNPLISWHLRLLNNVNLFCGDMAVRILFLRSPFLKREAYCRRSRLCSNLLLYLLYNFERLEASDIIYPRYKSFLKSQLHVIRQGEFYRNKCATSGNRLYRIIPMRFGNDAREYIDFGCAKVLQERLVEIGSLSQITVLFLMKWKTFKCLLSTINQFSDDIFDEVAIAQTKYQDKLNSFHLRLRPLPIYLRPQIQTTAPNIAV